MRYLDVCAGISASTVAWKPLGWEAAAYSEIEAAPRAVLSHHYPDTPLHGDFTTIKGDEYGPIDLLVGGTPCQDFSVAGLRAGLDGDRGNLSLEFLRLADRARPRWVVWENVPGVLSIDGGRAFGAILGGLGELGYGFAYRVLDAQFFGVPQRRRRVFVVGCAGDWRRAGAVLSERHSLSGHPAPRTGEGKAVAALTSAGVGTCGADDNQGQAGHLIPQAFGGGNTSGPIPVAAALAAHGRRQDFEVETFVTQPVPFDTTQITSAANYSRPQSGDPCHPLAAGAHPPAIAFNSREDCSHGLIAGALGSSSPQAQAVAYGISADAVDRTGEGDGSAAQRAGLGIAENVQPTLRCRGADSVGTASAVRRLTPRECERLQGFPDDYTLVPHRGKPMADGPRYKALGNSMAVPVMRWIGERIAAVEALERKDLSDSRKVVSGVEARAA